MYVFVYDWQTMNALKSNHLELVVPSGKSYLCFFEDRFGQLDFRVLKPNAETCAYMTPMRLLRDGEYRDIVKVLRKRVIPSSITLYRNTCFKHCALQAFRRLSFGVFNARDNRKNVVSLRDIIRLDRSWKLCSNHPEGIATSFHSVPHMEPRSTTHRRL